MVLGHTVDVIYSVLTLNLWGRKGPYRLRTKLIRECLQDLNPHIVGCQECLKLEGKDDVTDILTSLGYYTVFGHTIRRGDDYLYGNLIASKWDIKSSGVVPLPITEGLEPRAALTAEVNSPEGAILFVCAHLTYEDSESNVRAMQVASIRELLSNRLDAPGLPVILVGDFNALPESPEIASLIDHSVEGERLRFLDAWIAAGNSSNGVTVSPINPYTKIDSAIGRRIDYIFVGNSQRKQHRNPSVVSCKVVCDKGSCGVWPSDHFGVSALIRYDFPEKI